MRVEHLSRAAGCHSGEVFLGHSVFLLRCICGVISKGDTERIIHRTILDRFLQMSQGEHDEDRSVPHDTWSSSSSCTFDGRKRVNSTPDRPNSASDPSNFPQFLSVVPRNSADFARNDGLRNSLRSSGVEDLLWSIQFLHQLGRILVAWSGSRGGRGRARSGLPGGRGGRGQALPGVVGGRGGRGGGLLGGTTAHWANHCPLSSRYALPPITSPGFVCELTTAIWRLIY